MVRTTGNYTQVWNGFTLSKYLQVPTVSHTGIYKNYYLGSFTVMASWDCNYFPSSPCVITLVTTSLHFHVLFFLFPNVFVVVSLCSCFHVSGLPNDEEVLFSVVIELSYFSWDDLVLERDMNQENNHCIIHSMLRKLWNTPAV